MKQKAEPRAERFKSKGNQKQFQFNAELADIVEKAKEDFALKEQSKVAELLDQGSRLIHKRQKLIRIAESSEVGWDAVKEYESDDIASDEDDEKNIQNARASANRKRKQREKERQVGNSNKQPRTAYVGNQNCDDQLFRGICMTYFT